MKYRNEWKHEVNYSDILVLRQRLKAVMQPDIHAEDGKYLIRSLYFDDLYDKALREKINGIKNREKFRLRYYNLDPDYIKLEKKSKYNNLSQKEVVELTKEEVQKILDGDYRWMLDRNEPVLDEFYIKLTSGLFRPKALVDYTREPFTFPAGNVRVTLDYNLRSGLNPLDFLKADAVTIPIPDAPSLVEVKWDEFLPNSIRSAVGLKGRQAASFSKYAHSRLFSY